MISQNGINHLVGMKCTLTEAVTNELGDEFKGTLVIVAAISAPGQGTAFNACNDDGKPTPCLGLEACLKLHRANNIS